MYMLKPPMINELVYVNPQTSWSLNIAMFLYVVTVCCKYFGGFQFNQKYFPYWSLALLVLVIYCYVAGFIELVAIACVGFLLLNCVILQQVNNYVVKWIVGSLAVIILLMLGFHMLPGFNNQPIIQQQIIKGNSTPFNLTINFDKSLGGLIFFLTFIPKFKLPNFTTLKHSAILLIGMLITVLGFASQNELVAYNQTYFFKLNFLILFFLIQLFSTCLVEEVFFRGFIQARLYQLFNPNRQNFYFIPLLVTASLFALVHFSGGSIYMLGALLAGLGYGLIYQVSRHIEFTILAHVILNLTHLLLFTYPRLN
ncbi:CPBP family intramembrane glutamic endopeptidase [Aliikangiella maris]|uniref:CPBP family intramembrane glutamic endopeptidase n=2 Tax=Aliikangiella maris TaxID=3162458 RepID=A0ABV3MUL7_9GAMM